MHKDDIRPVLNLWPPGVLRQPLFMVGLGQIQRPYNAVLLPHENDDIMVRERFSLIMHSKYKVFLLPRPIG